MWICHSNLCIDLIPLWEYTVQDMLNYVISGIIVDARSGGKGL